jgi:hypothetical protein
MSRGLRQSYQRVFARILRLLARQSEDPIVYLSPLGVGTLFVRVPLAEVWRKTPSSVRIGAVLRLRWHPDEKEIDAIGRASMCWSLFGDHADFGPPLLMLTSWRASECSMPPVSSDQDELKAEALEASGILTRIRIGEAHDHGQLALGLACTAPFVCDLVFPLSVKTPVLALRTHLEVDARFAFRSVREANHPLADNIVAFLYELLLLQQKTVATLDEFLRAADYARRHKRQSMLIVAELNATMFAETVFMYLKATIEKTLALVGNTLGLPQIENYKEHKKRVEALRRHLPEPMQTLPYVAYLLELLASENHRDVNAFRSGILHKKGIADLQPHSYVSTHPDQSPLWAVFSVMKEQHMKNTAALIAALAILTDDLVERCQPRTTLADLEMVRSYALVEHLEWRRHNGFGVGIGSV